MTARISSMSWLVLTPGKVRQSKMASASDGMTLVLLPAFSPVGEQVLCSMAYSSRLIDSVLKIKLGGSTRPLVASHAFMPRPTVPPTPLPKCSIKPRAELVRCNGKLLRPMRHKAWPKCTTALSSCGTLACPGRPLARRRNHAVPFSAT